MARKMTPNEGGCWFCCTGEDDRNDWYFTFEFDAFFHMGCLKSAFESNKENPETILIANEFDLITDEERKRLMHEATKDWHE